MSNDNSKGAYSQWREALHPRKPAGTAQGGEFASIDMAALEQRTGIKMGGINHYRGVFYFSKADAEGVAGGVLQPTETIKQTRGFTIRRVSDGRLLGPNGWK
jgi:hypothetical protein